jgi:hypothetical protein
VTISTDVDVRDVHYDPYDVVVRSGRLRPDLPDDESRYITGVSLPVDAGSLLK